MGSSGGAHPSAPPPLAFFFIPLFNALLEVFLITGGGMMVGLLFVVVAWRALGDPVYVRRYRQTRWWMVICETDCLLPIY